MIRCYTDSNGYLDNGYDVALLHQRICFYRVVSRSLIRVTGTNCSCILIGKLLKGKLLEGKKLSLILSSFTSCTDTRFENVSGFL